MGEKFQILLALQKFIEVFRNPNYNFTLINWSAHNATIENYMDIGLHLVEKHGMFLERYAVWDNAIAVTHSSASVTTPFALMAMVACILATKVI